MTIDSNGAGVIRTRGPNGSSNVELLSVSSGNNNGAIYVSDSTGDPRAGIIAYDSGGFIWAGVKNFRMANPNDAATEIWYASLEGPEAAAYVRGTAQLLEGKATITFPDHFLAVASEAGMTIQLTPLSAESLGLAVVQKSLAGVVVQELHGGTGTYEFDFFITAVRQGYEDYEVIRPALEVQAAGEETEITYMPADRDDSAEEMEGDR